MRERVARPVNPAVGQAVRRERYVLQLTRAELLTLLHGEGLTHWHPTTVQRVEDGTQRVDVDDMASLVNVLGTDVLLGTPLGDALDIQPWEDPDAGQQAQE